jgi:hypothetical protein
MEGKLGESHSGELHRETAEQRANRIIAEELARRGWPESELATRRRSDPGKLAIAARLRSETTLPIRWIPARVQIKGLSPCSLIWLRAKTNAKPQAPSNPAPSSNSNLRLTPFCKEGLPVTNREAGCENKCASPYIGERFGENSVGGKWLMGAVLRIALTLTGRGQGAAGGVKLFHSIVVSGCKSTRLISRCGGSLGVASG